MSRRDGFPTNPEMMADFTETARQFYIATFNTLSEAGFHPGFIDKPLTSVVASAHRYHRSTESDLEGMPGSIDVETIAVTPLGSGEVDEPLPGSQWGESPPDDIVQYRTSLRERVSKTVVAEGLDVTDILLPGTVSASYVAWGQDKEPKRHTHSFDDRPSKMNIAGGKFIAEQALEHVLEKGSITIEDEDFEHDEVTQFGRFLRANVAHDDTLLTYVVTLGVEISPDLPLNGHEHPAFLEHMYKEMVAGAERHQEWADRLQSKGAPVTIINMQKEAIDVFRAAAKRAQDILDK